MAVYKFRVTYEDQEDISRDIEIKPNHSFEDLHLAIQQAIKFDASKTACFYMSDDYWRKGQEIPAANLKKSKLVDFIEDPHQKFIYLFDPSVNWMFYVELFKVLPDENGVKYPRCVKSIGSAPLQYRPVDVIVPGDNGEEDAVTDKDIDDDTFYSEAEELEEKGFSEVEEDAREEKHDEEAYANDVEEDEHSDSGFNEAGTEEEY